MRKIGVTLAVLLVSAVAAQAGLVTPSTDFTLVIAADGTATIKNNTAGDIRFGGYQVFTPTGILIPSTVKTATTTLVTYDTIDRGTTQWNPIQKQVKLNYDLSAIDPDGGAADVRVPGTGSNLNTHIAEIANGSNLVIPGGVSFSIGKIVPAGTTNLDLFTTQTGGVHTFQWGWVLDAVDGGGEHTGQVALVPEPATMSLLVIGGIATLIRRRR
ncbi:MAG: PEP-CTERM sorting domain-containing protein [Planctomycetota bacterium]|nr:PEP-CTERM sorting domain-containing protein [Planctomycetota bacterium]